jgi:N-acetylmuramoyl-L-alanine amidase CwlA
MNRIKNLTNTNFTNSDNRTIKYIVIHYVGAVSSAVANGNYFKEIYRGASAHYFIDENDCVQVVEDKNIAWHCGAYQYKNDCRNTNSIGIELCVKKTSNGGWYFEEATLRNAVELVKELLVKYPEAKLCRHYDVTGKICPEPMVSNPQLWNSFVEQCKPSQPITPPAQPKPLNDQYRTNKQGVNMRSGSSLNSVVVTVLPLGHIFNVYGIENNFYKTDGGFIKVGFADKIASATVPTPIQPKWYARYKTNATINVREGAGLNFKVLKLYKQGQVFDICQELNGWGKTPSGWVKLSFCTKI